jgi:hypothetical protein
VTLIPASLQPLWPSEWTAIGTVALALVILIAVITAIVITRQDRHRADARQIKAEADQAEGEAWAVQSMLAESWAGPKTLAGDQPDDTAKRLVATVVNGGTYAITDVKVMFSPEGQTLIGTERTDYLPALPPSWIESGLHTTGYAGVIIPGGAMRFVSEVTASDKLTSPYRLVRWRDRSRQRWEHRSGVVRRISDGEKWLA